MNTLVLTAIAMCAFAANSLLCRLALGPGLVDAVSFATIRIVSGAFVLGLLVLPRLRSVRGTKIDWRSVIALVTYMIFFSSAYRSLSAGTGALILFGAVQLTMIVVALRAGEASSPCHGRVSCSRSVDSSTWSCRESRLRTLSVRC